MDFVYLAVNEKNEEVMGCKSRDIIGRRVTEVHPTVRNGSVDWIDFLGKVALTGQHARLEWYYSQMQRWYNVFAFCPRKNYFAIISIDITARKKAEKELRESEKRFQQLAMHSPDTIYLLNTQTRKPTFLNHESFLGYSRAELESTGSIAYAVHPDDRSMVSVYWQQVLHGVEKGEIPVEYRVKSKTGDWEWIESRATTVKFDEGGKPLEILVTLSVITNRKKIEEAFKESEFKYRSLVESTSDWIWQVDNQGIYTYVSPKVQDILGYTPDEVLGKSPFEFMPVEEAQRISLVFEDKVRQKSSFRGLENIMLHKDGHIVYLETNGVPIENEEGDLLGYRGIDRDITERKIAEEALRESEELYRTLFDNSEDGFILVEPIFDTDGDAIDLRLMRVNNAYERQTGRKASVAEGKTALEVAPDLEKEWISISGKVAKNGKTVRFQNYNNHTKKWFDAHFFPFIKGRVGILFTDITNRKNLEAQLKEQERLAAIGQTAGMVGHDIRNPLQAMMSDVYLLKDNLQVVTDAKIKRDIAESLEGIEQNICYINKIVADLQDYARPLKPEYAPVNLSDFLGGIFGTISLPDNIEFQSELNTKCSVTTEPTFIRRILTNLINNAVQAMPEGGKLTVTCYQTVNQITIAVSDTGTGIPEEVKVKLFKPMTTTKSKGQGLGLAVVKRLIDALNGSITFESQEGKGTTFTIQLPINQ